MTCHKSLVLAAPLLHHTAPVEVSANLSPRAATRHPWAHRVVEAVGRPWEIFPWAVVGLWVLVPALYFVDTPLWMLRGAEALLTFFHVASLFWISVDVQAMDAGWWWLPLYMLGVPPLGPVVYLLWGRD
jgi:hypothetical protein